MRLIDADALKKSWSMGDNCEDCQQNARTCQYEQDFTRMDICEMLDEAPTVSGWISIKDRLPKKDGLYLCLTMYNNIKLYYQINLWEKNHWFWGNYDVRYWMPLPEPPKE